MEQPDIIVLFVDLLKRKYKGLINQNTKYIEDNLFCHYLIININNSKLSLKHISNRISSKIKFIVIKRSFIITEKFPMYIIETYLYFSSHHSFSLRTCSSSEAVKSFLMLKVLRISSGVFPLIILATVLQVTSKRPLMSR